MFIENLVLLVLVFSFQMEVLYSLSGFWATRMSAGGLGEQMREQAADNWEYQGGRRLFVG